MQWYKLELGHYTVVDTMQWYKLELGHYTVVDTMQWYKIELGHDFHLNVGHIDPVMEIMSC